MKISILFAACALASSVSMAQTAADPLTLNPGKAAVKSDATMQKGANTAMPMASTSSTSMGMGYMDMKAMDINSDGMISKAEWTSYHTKMWSKMKATKDMVSLVDMKANLRGNSAEVMPMKAANGTMPMGSMDMEMMDTDKDGMISKKEWMNHQTTMWSKMKTKNGMMRIADMETMFKAGPF